MTIDRKLEITELERKIRNFKFAPKEYPTLIQDLNCAVNDLLLTLTENQEKSEDVAQ